MTRWVFNEDGWTDWQQHDGKGCPCVGWWVQVETNAYSTNGNSIQGIAGVDIVHSWYWDRHKTHCASPIDRYRVRKPKGAERLERLAQDVPEPVDA